MLLESICMLPAVLVTIALATSTTASLSTNDNWNYAASPVRVSSFNYAWRGTPTATESGVCMGTIASKAGSVHDVTVGFGGRLSFAPNHITAPVGDVLRFTILALNHTLTQSTLIDPCTEAGLFNTGFNQFNPKNLTGRFVVEHRVRSLDPQWFFCAQRLGRSHCKSGMVFALNAGKKLEEFINAATGVQLTLAGVTSGLPATTTPFGPDTHASSGWTFGAGSTISTGNPRGSSTLTSSSSVVQASPTKHSSLVSEPTSSSESRAVFSTFLQPSSVRNISVPGLPITITSSNLSARIDRYKDASFFAIFFGLVACFGMF